ncbi:hypothetical protein R3W88_001894 [Solanum pinnatisectum]|uniref:Ubiquitin-like protease family profile domain-containing protein n=1 Tax=Solanum pinnatisectum TaxID=50273 RepID=A0AAV9MLG5_9SOLN|nr:hypothetical protein R3W88_001894 [Solanum pinnatisectum]
MNVFGDLLTFLEQVRFQQFMEQTPFGVFYELPHIKIQCQLLHHLLLIKTENVRDDMFIVKINAITSHKCGLLTDFVSDPSIPKRLIEKYFGIMTKVPKLDFLNKFKAANFFEPEDRFKIGIMYFISTFMTGYEASKTTIPKLYFDLVETGQYVNFAQGTEYFRNNPTSFKFSEFHLALQIWLYECCHPFDNTVAIRVANGTPHIFNSKTSNEIIFFEDLKNTIFRTYGNQMNVIDQNNLHESSSHRETEKQATLERNDVDLDEKYVELKNEIAEVDKHVIELKAYVDNSTKLIIDEIKSSRGQPTQTSYQEDDAQQHVEEIEKAQMDQPSVSMREYVDISNIDAQNSIDQTVGGVSNADLPGSSASKPPSLDDYPNLIMTQIFQLEPILNVTTTPDYDTSSYIRLLKGESSVRRSPIFSQIKHPFESHNGFEVADDLIDEFNKWIFKDKAKYSPQSLSYSTVDCWFMSWVDNIEKQWRDSNYDMRSISPDHNVGQCIRGYKLLANIPWDRVDDVIIPVTIRCIHVYDSMMGEVLHDKNVNIDVGKLATMIPLFLTSTGFYGKKLDLYANKLPKYVDKSQSDPLEVKHMKNVPQQDETSNDCGMYTCLFVEYVSNGVFDIHSIGIDAKYHRQSEVTGTVASKFGGPRIDKEHVLNTSNYPTPKPRRSNLR